MYRIDSLQRSTVIGQNERRNCDWHQEGRRQLFNSSFLRIGLRGGAHTGSTVGVERVRVVVCSIAPLCSHKNLKGNGKEDEIDPCTVVVAL